jgi:hypothetical protein
MFESESPLNEPQQSLSVGTVLCCHFVVLTELPLRQWLPIWGYPWEIVTPLVWLPLVGKAFGIVASCWPVV